MAEYPAMSATGGPQPFAMKRRREQAPLAEADG